MSIRAAIESLAAELAKEFEAIQLVDARTAARMLGVSEATFRRMGVPVVRFGESKQSTARYRVTDIRAAVEKHLNQDFEEVRHE